MRQARLADGRTLDIPDWMDDETAAKGIKQYWDKDQREQGEKRQREEQEKLLQQQREEMDRAETKEMRAEAVQIGMGKIQGMQSLAGGMMQLSQMMAGVIDGLNRVSMLENKMEEVIQSIDTMAKVMAVSTQEITSALLTPKKITTNNSGAVTGIRPDIEDERIN